MRVEFGRVMESPAFAVFPAGRLVLLVVLCLLIMFLMFKGFVTGRILGADLWWRVRSYPHQGAGEIKEV